MSNVVSIFQASKKNNKDVSEKDSVDIFKATMKKNEERKDKLAKERAQANKALLKLYNIKTS